VVVVVVVVGLEVAVVAAVEVEEEVVVVVVASLHRILRLWVVAGGEEAELAFESCWGGFTSAHNDTG
jgi:hypothetical protein